jgi:hypothetical protein
MTSISHSGIHSLYGDRAASVADAVGGKLKKLARRVSDTLDTQRRREVDSKIAYAYTQSGGRLTDSLEREIERRVFGSDWRLPD